MKEVRHYVGHHMEENVAANKGEDKATNQAEDEDDWDCEASSEDDDGDHIGPLNPKREDADVELGWGAALSSHNPPREYTPLELYTTLGENIG